jgi:CheY-like chemotaxis protein
MAGLGPGGACATQGFGNRRRGSRLPRGVGAPPCHVNALMDRAIPLSSGPLSTSTPRVLVVDDEPAFRDAARQLLERRGYAVVAEAGSAASALDGVASFAPDAVLLDVRLGEDDGFEVCRSLTRTRPGLAVLLVSTDDHYQYGERVASCGARGFVSKMRLLDTDFGRFWPRT